MKETSVVVVSAFVVKGKNTKAHKEKTIVKTKFFFHNVYLRLPRTYNASRHYIKSINIKKPFLLKTINNKSSIFHFNYSINSKINLNYFSLQLIVRLKFHFLNSCNINVIKILLTVQWLLKGKIILYNQTN